MKDVNILAIETSCDETAAAIIRNGREVIKNEVYSQIDIHKEYGGVVPEIASRNHILKLPHVVGKCGFEGIDAVAVTYGPGLLGALICGVSYAKALAYSMDLPLIAVHHIEGHISANFISHKELEPPFVCLTVSGGHTMLAVVRDYGVYETLGQTRDDAAGEVIDKVSRVLGLPYPGGPNLEKLAENGDRHAYEMPRSFKGEKHLDFSFSGPKTTVINMLHHMDQTGETYKKEDVAASFLYSVVDALADNAFEAVKRTGINKLAVAGGVSANRQLREELKKRADENGCELYIPDLKYCTDNAAMIGSAAYYKYLRGDFAPLDLNAYATLPLGES